MVSFLFGCALKSYVFVKACVESNVATCAFSDACHFVRSVSCGAHCRVKALTCEDTKIFERRHLVQVLCEGSDLPGFFSDWQVVCAAVRGVLVLSDRGGKAVLRRAILHTFRSLTLLVCVLNENQTFLRTSRITGSCVLSSVLCTSQISPARTTHVKQL